MLPHPSYKCCVIGSLPIVRHFLSWSHTVTPLHLYGTVPCFANAEPCISVAKDSHALPPPFRSWHFRHIAVPCRLITVLYIANALPCRFGSIPHIANASLHRTASMHCQTVAMRFEAFLRPCFAIQIGTMPRHYLSALRFAHALTGRCFAFPLPCGSPQCRYVA